MALPRLNRLKCIILVRRGRRSSESDMEAFEKMKSVVERVREGVSVERVRCWGDDGRDLDLDLVGVGVAEYKL